MTCSEKSVVKGDRNKSGRTTKAKRRVQQEEVGLEVSLIGIHRKRDLIFVRIERNRTALKSALQSNQSSLGSPHSSRSRWGGRLDGQVVSIKRTADGSKETKRDH